MVCDAAWWENDKVTCDSGCSECPWCWPCPKWISESSEPWWEKCLWEKARNCDECDLSKVKILAQFKPEASDATKCLQIQGHGYWSWDMDVKPCSVDEIKKEYCTAPQGPCQSWDFSSQSHFVSNRVDNKAKCLQAWGDRFVDECSYTKMEKGERTSQDWEYNFDTGMMKNVKSGKCLELTNYKHGYLGMKKCDESEVRQKWSVRQNEGMLYDGY